MPVPIDKFIKEKAATGEFYLFRVQAPEWVYVLRKLDEEFFDRYEDPEDPLLHFGILVPSDGGDEVYWARKSLVPEEEIMRRFGLRLEQLGAQMFLLPRLGPLGPEPTVDYYGEA